MLKITLNLGDHEINLYPVIEDGIVQETLRATFTWHSSIFIHDWTIGKLAIIAANCDLDNYIMAEKKFIRACGELPRQFEN